MSWAGCRRQPQQGPPLRRQRASAGDPQQFRLVQGPAGQPAAQVVAGGGPGAARGTLPVEPGDDGVRDGGGALRETGEEGEDTVADLGGRGAVQTRSQRRQRTVLRVPPADQARRAGRGQPRRGEQGPAFTGGQLKPLVVTGRRRVPFVGLAVRGQQPRRVGQLDPERGHRFRHVQSDRRPLQVPHAQTAGAQHGRPALVPVLEEFLDGGERGVGLAGRGRVHHLRTVRPGLFEGRCHRVRLPVRAARPQMQGHLTGQHDRAGRRRQQQRAVDQPAQMTRRIGRHLAVRRPPHQPGQHLQRLGGRRVEQRRHPLPVGEQGDQ